MHIPSSFKLINRVHTSTSNPHASLAYLVCLDGLPFQDGLQEAAESTPLWKMFKSGQIFLPRCVDTK
jgi:hypothetical protein